MIFHPFLGAGTKGAKVKAYSSEEKLPSAAKDGTMAVISATSVGNVYVQNTSPSTPSAQDLLIVFSANGNLPAVVGDVVLYPNAAVQYLNGSWTRVPLKIFIKGAWHDAVADTVLYSNGNEAQDITGGWYASSALEFIKEASRLTIASGVVSTVLRVDLTYYSALKVKVQCTSGNPSYIGIGRTPTYIEIQTATGSNESSASTRVVDLSGVEGEYYILVQSRSEGSPTYVYSVELIA